MPYFDAASSVPLHPVARQALAASLDEGWADPSRLHREGRRARLLLDAARETAAEAVGCRPDELVFTPSGTGALHRGIAGALAGRRRVGRRLAVSAVEHSAVLHAASAHREEGGSVTEVPVDRRGRVSAAAYEEALTEETALACLQSANHETGTVQPVAEIAGLCAEAGVPLLVDAAQSLAWDRPGGGWSLLAGSAHKWGGPPGVGLLAVRKGVRFAAPPPADEREQGRSPGFENIPAIVAAAASLRAVRADADAVAARLRPLIERVRAEVPRAVPDVEVVGDPVHRLPHVVTFSCLYVDGEALLHALDRAGFSVSSGSSCTSSTLTPSHVLLAMGVLSEGNIRLSLPPTPEESVEADVERFLQVLPEAVREVREQLNAPAVPRERAAGYDAAVQDAAVQDAAVQDEGTNHHAARYEEQRTVPAEGARELTVDALGTLCPMPVIELARNFDDVPVGGVITVLADDEAARVDIPAWCEMRGQEYLGAQGTRYRVRRLS
ncbi:cysteine desulfurase/sulfurtransferase TusA family protein [Streptomyces ovatisporus]|uniref:Cysteine desulfurase/sulfurtransferase TusA family protein n=1 Tax=Streptomyces ovatisporus TaxID=1128682 RepID=A0ABV9AF90_9ACTN